MLQGPYIPFGRNERIRDTPPLYNGTHWGLQISDAQGTRRWSDSDFAEGALEEPAREGVPLRLAMASYLKSNWGIHRDPIQTYQPKSVGQIIDIDSFADFAIEDSFPTDDILQSFDL